jgi:exopolysaccharide biosynthesis polyprenyl glycosylphosphotransferase
MRAHVPKSQLILLAGDIVLIALSLYLAPSARFGLFVPLISVVSWNSLFCLLLYPLIFYIFDFYRLDRELESYPRYLMKLAIVVIIGGLFIPVPIYVFRLPQYGREVLVLTGVFVFGTALCWRLILIHLRRSRKPLPMIILGAGKSGRTLWEALRQGGEYEVVGFLDDDKTKWGKVIHGLAVLGGIDRLPELVKAHGIQKVVVAITRHVRQEIYKLLVDAKFDGVVVYDMPSFYQRLLGKVPVLHVSDMWFVYADLYGVSKNLYTIKVKKLLDRVFGLVGLILALPVMAAIAVSIKIDSRGPVFYRQDRTGLDGAAFTLLKFRSMIKEAEKNGAVWATEKDPRVTRVGKVIRLLRIDELPQIWNVLKGEMSLVGPRPERPEFVRDLAEQIPYYSLRHSVKPGLTGWAQINYRYGASKDDAMEKLQYDLYYIKNMSLLFDLQILLKTVKVVIFVRGAR